MLLIVASAYGGWCRLALKRTISRLVSQMQCGGGVWRRVGSGWSKSGVSHSSLREGPSFVLSRIAQVETFNPVHVLLGWSSISVVSLMMHFKHPAVMVRILVS
jgi:hypothetical protein